jgi:hypothetical protein
MDNNNLSMDDLLKLAEQKIGNLSDSDSASNADNILEQTLHSFSHKPNKPLQQVQTSQPSQPLQQVQPSQPLQQVQTSQPLQQVQPKTGVLSHVKSKLNTLFSKSITVYGFKFTFETLLFIVIAVFVGVLLFKLTRDVKKYKPLPQQLSDKNNKKRVKNNNT